MESETAYRGRHISSGNTCDATPATGSRRGLGAAVLLFLLLPLRTPEEFAGFYSACNVTGVVVSADVVRAIQQFLCTTIRPLRSDPADVAGNCHGNGAGGKRAQRGPGKCSGLFNSGRGSHAPALRRRSCS